MKKTECCSACGSKLVQYTHNMGVLLANALERFVIDSKGKEVVLKDTTLTHTQIANFQKLRYFDLVEKVPNSIKWAVTLRGIQFLNGVISISQQAITFRGKRVAYSREVVFFHELTGHSYKTREEYAKESLPIKSPYGEQLQVC